MHDDVPKYDKVRNQGFFSKKFVIPLIAILTFFPVVDFVKTDSQPNIEPQQNIQLILDIKSYLKNQSLTGFRVSERTGSQVSDSERRQISESGAASMRFYRITTAGIGWDSDKVRKALESKYGNNSILTIESLYTGEEQLKKQNLLSLERVTTNNFDPSTDLPEVAGFNIGIGISSTKTQE